jgi:tRNA 2-thiouridine synthesizing protein A
MEIRNWNAGEAGCGSLIAGLKCQIGRVRPGQLLRITANSAGAPADLPAWCRLTGHLLVEADHPTYVIRKTSKGERNV